MNNHLSLKCSDKVVDVCSLGGGDNFLVGCFKSAVTDIFHNCSVVKPCILQDHSECFTQTASVEITDIVTVNLDCAVVYVIKTH